MKQSFYGGVHPNDRKELARHKEVAPLSAAPKQVVIAMAMHVGAPCKPIVAVGDQVKVGQKIGEIAGLGAPIHASVSGVVKAVNEELLDNPALVNEDPYGAWLIQVEQMTDEEELLDAAAYEAHCAAEEG